MKTTATSIVLTVCAAALIGNGAVAQVSEEVLKSIHTPNEVETSIGKLKFIDGAPVKETSDKVYDYLDTARAMDAFLKGQPAAWSSGSFRDPTRLARWKRMKSSSSTSF